MPHQDTIPTPKEIATKKAGEILSKYGYNHPGTVIDYDNAVEILVDLLLQQQNQTNL